MMSRQLRTPSNQIGPDVLSAALELLAETGPDGFTVRAIAQRAGVAPMAIYNHFDGKNGVLEAIWTDGFEQLRSDLSETSGDVKTDILNAGLAYRVFALGHRAHYTVMFMHRFVGFEPSLEAAHTAATAFQELVNHVERCQSEGLFATEKATNVAQMMWATCHGYVSLEILNENFSDDPDLTYVRLLTWLRDGMAT